MFLLNPHSSRPVGSARSSTRMSSCRSICSECRKPRSSRFRKQYSNADGALSICSRNSCREAKAKANAIVESREYAPNCPQVCTFNLRLIVREDTGALEVYLDPALPSIRNIRDCKDQQTCFEADSRSLYGHELPCGGEGGGSHS